MNFKLDALVSWEPVVPKEILEFDAVEPRRVRLAVVCNAPVEIWASYPVEPFVHDTKNEKVDPELRDVLVGFGSGQFETEFTTIGTTYVRFLGDEETSIFVRGFAPDMRVPESDEEIYTSVMPRERRNSEFDRMMMWTKLNEARRDQQLQEALAQIRSSAAPVEPAPAPAAPAALAPEADADGA